MPKPAKPLPAIERLNELLKCYPESGELVWRVNRRGTARAGAVAGSARSDGYIRVKVDGTVYFAHRIIWTMAHGEAPPPDNDIDHRNRDTSDNRVENLRVTSHSANNRNAKKSRGNTSGVTGVCRNKGGWFAQISDNDGSRKRKWFKSLEAACQWRLAMEKKLGYDPSHGRDAAAT